ncbi:hypothetical protein RvY_18520 [Ramazzottius varieornatus]|uniref:Uncharacterized protein n=1 Tax=Ramazzottius varieornatus TaxID=947166 RepID=A0A1D1WAK1_RAMVA|nr:hypothetical protein RvY_18520 [Ramazzottius varieornatus]
MAAGAGTWLVCYPGGMGPCMTFVVPPGLNHGLRPIQQLPPPASPSHDIHLTNVTFTNGTNNITNCKK